MLQWEHSPLINSYTATYKDRVYRIFYDDVLYYANFYQTPTQDLQLLKNIAENEVLSEEHTNEKVNY